MNQPTRTVRSPLAIIATAALSGCAFAGPTSAVDLDRSFFSDYSRLHTTTTTDGVTELLYVAPGTLQRLASFDGIMVDQPELSFSTQSEYRRAKPDDLVALVDVLRQEFDAQMSAGGYRLASAPGPGILQARLALTDLSLKRKKRSLLAYTPIGAAIKTGADAIRDMTEKYDVMDVTIQAELADSQTGEVLVQLVELHSADEKPARTDFHGLSAAFEDLGLRLRRRLDNAHLTAAEHADAQSP